jgi:hypothetical protein
VVSGQVASVGTTVDLPMGHVTQMGVMELMDDVRGSIGDVTVMNGSYVYGIICEVQYHIGIVFDGLIDCYITLL